MKLVWTDESILDLQEIRDYIARDSQFYASIEIEKIFSYEKQMCDYPYSGRTVPEYSDEYIREFIEGPYRIIYRIAGDSLIQVLTVVHGSRDISERTFE